ncbi:hypothetical protein SPHINGOR109_60004 [Sphingorhabdus sp. 109]|nr:hypothetical protein SPHINGOR109_60004 [Sphingorhabdus sp. 109]
MFTHDPVIGSPTLTALLDSRDSQSA